MSAESKPESPAGPRPEAHWYAHCPGAALPPHELVVSPHQAVCAALAALGRDAPAAELRRFLAGHGMEVEESLIEQVRRELPGHPDPEC